MLVCLQHVSDQSFFSMQRGVRDEELKLNEMEQTLTGMSRLEKLVLGMWPNVCLR